ncbi:MAG: hypothetical protein QF536_10555, partial [Arenicellales bacterium]|nr:hypothetical protein [Arenicellales bacterium]
MSSMVKKVMEKPSWEGLNFLRARKQALVDKHLQLVSAWEEMGAKLSPSENDSPERQQEQQELMAIENHITLVEDDISACELVVAEKRAG